MNDKDARMMLVPMVIEQTGRGERAYDIYSRLLRDNIIFIGTPIDDNIGNLRHNAVCEERCHYNMHWSGSQHGSFIALGRREQEAAGAPQFEDSDSPALDGRPVRSGNRYRHPCPRDPPDA